MTSLGKYELHEQLGRGGFGTVYRAIDTTLDRVVALKILHPQLTTDPDFLERFRNEARLVASLRSPHIVTIHELGEVDGRVFIAMEYLAGGSLKQRLESGPIPYPETVEIMRQVCDGLSVAHAKGLVHRDIKPGNILLDEDGRAVIADFGLARAVQLSSTSTSSSTGGVGTPAYRAPELWRGKPPASPATDIYSLGCVLAEMLTGKVLFDGATPDEIITQHLVDGPNLNYPWLQVGLPSSVGEVLHKSLQRDPALRYTGSLDLIHDLSEITLGQEESQRKVVVTVSERSQPDTEEKTGEQNQRNQNPWMLIEARPNQKTSPKKISLKTIPRWGWVLSVTGFMALLFLLSWRGLFLPTSSIFGKLQATDVSFPLSIQTIGKGAALQVTVSADGKKLAVSTIASIYVYDIKTLSQVAQYDLFYDSPKVIAFTPDGNRLAFGAIKNVYLWDMKQPPVELGTHEEPVNSILFSPDGQILVSGSGKDLRIWNISNSQLMTVLDRKTTIGYSYHLAISPDGKLLAYSVDPGDISLYDLQKQMVVSVLPVDVTGIMDNVLSLNFSPNGKYLAAGSLNYAVNIWEVASGKKIKTLDHGGSLIRSIFSPDGATLVTCGSFSVKLWNTSDWAIRREIHVLGGNDIAFTPDGSELIISSDYEPLSFWDPKNGERIRTVAGHDGDIIEIAYSPNGEFLASASAGVTLYDAETGNVVRNFAPDFEKEKWVVQNVAFSPDSSLLVRSEQSISYIYRVSDGSIAATLPGSDNVKFTPDGKRLVIGNYDSFEIWDTTKWKSICRLKDTGWAQVGVSPDGKLLAVGDQGNAIHIINIESCSEIKTINDQPNWVEAVAFSPDGNTLAAATDGVIRRWDTTTWSQYSDIQGYGPFQYTPDGKNMVFLRNSAPIEGTVWNAWYIGDVTWVNLLNNESKIILSPIYRAKIAVSPDGRTLAVSGNSGMLYLVKLY